MTTIVIGAGLAGLFAARALHDAGEEVIVLEATDHLGGRTRGVRGLLHHDQVADVGASFIDIGQDALLEFCVRQDLRLAPQVRLLPREPRGSSTGASGLRGRIVSGGRAVADAERWDLADEVQLALEQDPPDRMETLLAWSHRVGLSPGARDAYAMQGSLAPQARRELVSSWHVHPGDAGQVRWMLADGADSIARAVAEGLNLVFGSPVRWIGKEPVGYTVHTDDDSFPTQYVVVTSSVQATRRIGFDPVLPEWKTEALLTTPMSQGGKIIAQYADADRIVDAAGQGAMTDSPVGRFWFKRGPEDTLIAMGAITDGGEGLLTRHAAALQVLDRQIEALTGSPPDRIAGLVHDWTTEEFVGGVVSLDTGGFERRAVLAAPVGGLHFAGEATGERTGTMEAAVRSGRRAADEILQKRRRGRSRSRGGSR